MIVWFVWSVVVAAGIAFVYVAASYWSNLKKQYLVEMPPKETYTLPPDGHEYTKEDLAQYDGDCGKAILIALKGTVYDITSHPSGRQFYGKSAGYGIFAGKDASRALATMTFDDISSSSLEGLTEDQLRTLDEWKAKYDEKYKAVGTLRPSAE
ncbi:Cytochrome b5 heme-binding domain-containing protein [Plasmodiophora brassicae]